MIVRLQKIDTTGGDDSFAPRASSPESPMIADRANIPSLAPVAGSNRRLRNRLILVNIVAWIVIILAIRMIFF